MDNDMDLTTLNSSKTCHDATTLSNELKDQQEIEKKLQNIVDDIRASVFKYKSMYESECSTIDLLLSEVDSIKSNKNDQEIMEKNEIENDMKIHIDSLQNDLDKLRENSDEVINNLKISIAQIELNPPTMQEETIDSEIYEIMEENLLLNEEKKLICEALKEIDTKYSEMLQKSASVETELKDIQDLINFNQQECKKCKEAFEEKMEHKVMMLTTLSQMSRKPLSEVSGKPSLFDEVNDNRSNISMKYQILKNKHMKAKEVLSKMNAEIKKINNESLKHNHIFSDLENDSQKTNENLVLNQLQRIQDLDKFIEMLDDKHFQSLNKEVVLINSSNFSTVQLISEVAKAEEKRIHEDIMNVLALKLPLEQTLTQRERELKNSMNQLKIKIESQLELEKKIKDLQYNESNKSKENSPLNPKPPSEDKKKNVRFAEEIKYEDDKKVEKD